LDLFNESLKITKVNHDNDLEVATVEINIASLYQQFDKNKQALLHYVTALQIYFSTLGYNHTHVSVLLSDISLLLTSLSLSSMAQDTYNLVLDLNLILYGRQHPSTAKSYLNFGNYLKKLNSVDLAKTYLQEAYSIFKTLYGEQDKKTIESLQDFESLKTV